MATHSIRGGLAMEARYPVITASAPSINSPFPGRQARIGLKRSATELMQ